MAAEKKKKRRVIFGLAPKLILSVVLIAAIIAAASVMIGRNIYLDDISNHYKDLAYNIAHVEMGVFEKGFLEEWSDVAVRYAKGQATKEERDAIVESDKYKELKELTANLCSEMGMLDIYVGVYDIETVDAFTQEAYDNQEWKPLVYIIDTYYKADEQFPFGAASRINSKNKDLLKERWVNAEQTSKSAMIVTPYNGIYILTGSALIIYDGVTYALVGVEFAMPTLAADLDDYTWQIITVDLIVLAVIIVIAVVLLMFLLIRPLKTVAGEAERFVDDNTEVSEVLKTIKTHDELQVLSESLLSLEYGIREYISEVTKMAAEKERVGAELAIASDIQNDMMPKDFPKRGDYDLYASMVPAKEVGGDFYDFFMLDEDHLGLVMADVSGKGVPAALFMAITKTVLRNACLGGRTPSKSLELTNKIMCVNNKSGYFVTAWLGILSISTGELVYSNAGHEFPAIKRGAGQYELITSETFPPLALEEDLEYVDQSITLAKGDSIFLYTDGVPEAKSDSGERFGTDKMLFLLNSGTKRSSKDIVTGMQQQIGSFAGNVDQFDDITMMNVNYYGINN